MIFFVMKDWFVAFSSEIFRIPKVYKLILYIVIT